MSIRAEIPIVVQDANGNAVNGASVNINIRGGAAATVYADETSATTRTQPLLTDSYGRVSGWLARGQYDAQINAAGFPAYVEPLDIAPAGDGSVDRNWIADLAVNSAKLDDNSVLAAKLTDSAVSAVNQTGTLAARPAATSVKAGSIYFATDDWGGTLYRSTGTAWVAQLSANQKVNVVTNGITTDFTVSGNADFAYTLEWFGLLTYGSGGTDIRLRVQGTSGWNMDARSTHYYGHNLGSGYGSTSAEYNEGLGGVQGRIGHLPDWGMNGNVRGVCLVNATTGQGHRAVSSRMTGQGVSDNYRTRFETWDFRIRDSTTDFTSIGIDFGRSFTGRVICKRMV